MALLACLVLAFVFSCALRRPIKRAPWLFYLLAALVDVLVIAGSQLDVPQWVHRTLILANGRGMFAFGLFTVVMFLGALGEGSRVRRWLMPIRAELSIVASILAVGHVVRYADVYSPRILAAPSAAANGMLVSFLVAAVLVVLLAVLGVTSLRAVKRHMSGRTWKGVQRLAYPFFVLIYAHVLLILARPALQGAHNAQVSLVIYGVVVAAYVVLRLARWREALTRCDAPTQTALRSEGSR